MIDETSHFTKDISRQNVLLTCLNRSSRKTEKILIQSLCSPYSLIVNVLLEPMYSINFITIYLFEFALLQQFYFSFALQNLKPTLIVTWAVGDWHKFRVISGHVYRGLSGGFRLLRIFSVAISVSPQACFYLRDNSDFYVSKIYTCKLGIFHANQTIKCQRNQSRTKGEGWSIETS